MACICLILPYEHPVIVQAASNLSLHEKNQNQIQLLQLYLKGRKLIIFTDKGLISSVCGNSDTRNIILFKILANGVLINLLAHAS